MEQVTSAVPESTAEDTKPAMTLMLSFTPEMVTPGSLLIDLYAEGTTCPILLSVPLGLEIPFNETADVEKIIKALMNVGSRKSTDWRVLGVFQVNKVSLIDGIYRYEYGSIVAVPHLDEDGCVADYQILADDEELDFSIHRVDRHEMNLLDKANNEKVCVHVVDEDHPVKDGDVIATIYDLSTQQNFIYNLYGYHRRDDEEVMNCIACMIWITQCQGISDYTFATGTVKLSTAQIGEMEEGYLPATLTDPSGMEYDFEIPEEHFVKVVH